VKSKLERTGKLGLAVLSQNSSGKIRNTKVHNNCGQVLYQTRMQETTGIIEHHICGTPCRLSVTLPAGTKMVTTHINCYNINRICIFLTANLWVSYNSHIKHG
jgi:hypothetical protein